jgi:hypothetical protein
MIMEIKRIAVGHRRVVKEAFLKFNKGQYLEWPMKQ